jgi:membrane protein DedA with SNARE-associated domain
MALPSIPGLAALAAHVDVPALLAGLFSAYDRFGYALVFVGAWLEHSILLGVFVPGGTMVSIGGAAARLGTLRLPLAIAVGALGMITGACTDYWIGRSGLARVLLRSRLGPRLKPGLNRASTLLQRHGWWAITLVHAMGAGRSAVAVTAGICRMRFPAFVVCEVPAALLWSTLFNLLGYGVATNLDLILQVLRRAGLAIAIALAAALVARALWRRRVLRSRPA